jgi:hypothetical protein
MGWIKSTDGKRMEWFPDEQFQRFLQEQGYKWERNGDTIRYWREVNNPTSTVTKHEGWIAIEPEGNVMIVDSHVVFPAEGVLRRSYGPPAIAAHITWED